jgi:hypothetical protein
MWFSGKFFGKGVLVQRGLNNNCNRLNISDVQAPPLRGQLKGNRAHLAIYVFSVVPTAVTAAVNLSSKNFVGVWK